MRGADIPQESLFTTAKLDDFVPSDHPLRAIRALTDQALRRMSGLFSTLYADTGRHSIAPEKLKSFRPKDGPPDGGGPRNAPPDFKGQKRKNDSHASISDPDSRLYRKGNTGAQLSYQGHVLMEHRNGLVRSACVSQATGHGERESALRLLKQPDGRRSAIDGRTTRHTGYAMSLKTRVWIETHFGWIKAAVSMRRACRSCWPREPRRIARKWAESSCS